MTDLVTSVLMVDGHTFGVVDAGSWDREPGPGPEENGLIKAITAGAEVHTGIAIGPVWVAVGLLPGPPDRVETQPWQDVAEVSVHAPAGDLWVAAYEDCPDDLPLLSPQGPGWYRLRVHVRGRDEHFDEAVEEPGEEYLLLVWPAARQDPVVHQATDTCGRTFRQSRAAWRAQQF